MACESCARFVKSASGAAWIVGMCDLSCPQRAVRRWQTWFEFHGKHASRRELKGHGGARDESERLFYT